MNSTRNRDLVRTYWAWDLVDGRECEVWREPDEAEHTADPKPCRAASVTTMPDFDALTDQAMRDAG